MEKDPWHYPRGELAAHLLKVMDSGLVSRIAIFAARRKGKTWFVLRDLAPASIKDGYVPVFASLWRTPDKPHVAIAEGFAVATEALQRKRVPWADYLSKLASFSATVAGAGIGVGFAHATPPSSTELSVMAEALNQLAHLAVKKKRRVLLLVDEAQHLATRAAFESVAKGLRTAMEGIEATNPNALRTLFTGSSRTDLAALLEHRNAAFYGSFDNQVLPDLTCDYTDFLTHQLIALGGIKVDANDLFDLFIEFESSPYNMQIIVRELMLHRAKDLHQARDILTEAIINNPEIVARWDALSSIEKAVYLRVCRGDPLYAKATIKAMAKELHEQLENSHIQNAVRLLQKRGLVSSKGRGDYHNADSELLTWLEHRPDQNRRESI